jgi:hemerythrin-like domain-containing protein
MDFRPEHRVPRNVMEPGLFWGALEPGGIAIKATEDLKHEHEIILLVLGGVEHQAQSAAEVSQLDGLWLGKLVDFCRNFVDRCHHAKEERYLIPRMEARGLSPDDRAIYFTLREHEQGREFVRAIAAALPAVTAGDGPARVAIAGSLAAYVQLLRSHIQKENEVLFPLADRLFTAEDQAELQEAFEQVEAEEIGEGIHEKYHQLAHELAGHT